MILLAAGYKIAHLQVPLWFMSVILFISLQEHQCGRNPIGWNIRIQKVIVSVELAFRQTWELWKVSELTHREEVFGFTIVFTTKDKEIYIIGWFIKERFSSAVNYLMDYLFFFTKIWKLHNLFDINCSNCNSCNFLSNCNCRNHSFASTQFSLRGGHCHHISLVNYFVLGKNYHTQFYYIYHSLSMSTMQNIEMGFWNFKRKPKPNRKFNKIWWNSCFPYIAWAKQSTRELCHGRNR